MTTVLMTPENLKVVVSEKTDECLYRSPRNPANTGQEFTIGTDLFAHKARSGKIYYYLSEWSMWQGADQPTYLVTEEKAKEFLLEKAGLTGWGSLDDSDKEEIMENHFPNLFEENA